MGKPREEENIHRKKTDHCKSLLSPLASAWSQYWHLGHWETLTVEKRNGNMIGARAERLGPGFGPYVCITGIIHALNSQPRTVTSAFPTFGIIQNSQCNNGKETAFKMLRHWTNLRHYYCVRYYVSLNSTVSLLVHLSRAEIRTEGDEMTQHKRHGLLCHLPSKLSLFVHLQSFPSTSSLVLSWLVVPGVIEREGGQLNQ